MEWGVQQWLQGSNNRVNPFCPALQAGNKYFTYSFMKPLSLDSVISDGNSIALRHVFTYYKSIQINNLSLKLVTKKAGVKDNGSFKCYVVPYYANNIWNIQVSLKETALHAHTGTHTFTHAYVCVHTQTHRITFLNTLTAPLSYPGTLPRPPPFPPRPQAAAQPSSRTLSPLFSRWMVSHLRLVFARPSSSFSHPYPSFSTISPCFFFIALTTFYQHYWLSWFCVLFIVCLSRKNLSSRRVEIFVLFIDMSQRPKMHDTSRYAINTYWLNRCF